MLYEQLCLNESGKYFCLNQALVCDGLAHCVDASDETDCGEPCHLFSCRQVLKSWVVMDMHVLLIHLSPAREDGFSQWSTYINTYICGIYVCMYVFMYWRFKYIDVIRFTLL